MKKNVLCALLLAAMLLSGCGKTTPEAVPETLPAETVIETETETLFEPDDLPDDLKFSGTSVSWYVGDYNDAYRNGLYYQHMKDENMFNNTKRLYTGFLGSLITNRYT